MELSDIGLKITISYVQGIKRQGKEENLNRKQKVIKKNEIKILEMKNKTTGFNSQLDSLRKNL